ncbi:hypothetical protein [Arthrobacter koreensis]|uniref:hypothetical protein n=1 Tax=Arthrobacter koreensis TaxID=199136 RepID=UPI002DBBF4D1|nr:hypothetical protein [Arthrobacter koreensis]MEB7503249.1 hypothetical protein [Arthrobacter koreensis]
MTPSTADAGTGSASPASSPEGRPAGAIFADFTAMAAEAVDATETAGWTYADGSPWDPANPDIVFTPTPCQTSQGSGEDRYMQFELSGPAPEDSLAARDRMQAFLEERGYRITRSIDAPPESKPKRTHLVTAESPGGALIDYGANDEEQLFFFESECSDHPSMEGDVSAETP